MGQHVLFNLWKETSAKLKWLAACLDWLRKIDTKNRVLKLAQFRNGDDDKSEQTEGKWLKAKVN